MSLPDRQRLDLALTRLLDGEPELADGELLAQAMSDDAGFRREVTGLLAVDELLRQNAELSPNDFAEAFAERLADNGDQIFADRVQNALSAQSEIRNPQSAISKWWLAAAAVFVIAGLSVFTFFSTRTRVPQVEVATLLLAENCEWDQAGVAQEGSRLSVGPLRLRKGMAVLRFDGGAELILRGETEIEFQSAGGARLARGEVTVRAPEEAAGFKLWTPASEVIDLGTEFAAKVERSGATELHVIEGEIAVNAASSSGGRGEVLHAGKAVRFDDVTMITPREVQMRADRFEEIVRASRPAPRADLMFAYEGFSYRAGRLPTPEGNGGLGWRGPWHAAAKNEAYRDTEDPVTGLSIVHGDAKLPWPLVGGQPGTLELPMGTRSFARTLARPIALDKDGIYYFSFMVHEPDFAPDLDARNFGGVRLVFRSSASPNGDMLSFGPSRLRVPAIRAGAGRVFNSPVQVARNQDTLWIGKIIARPEGDDEIFFSIYGERDPLGYAEPATWQVASRRLQRGGQLDTVVIATQLSSACTVDELRIGPTWRSVAPMQEPK